MASRILGSGIKRREDPRLITGQAKYTDDIALPGMVYDDNGQLLSGSMMDYAVPKAARSMEGGTTSGRKQSTMMRDPASSRSWA